MPIQNALSVYARTKYRLVLAPESSPLHAHRQTEMQTDRKGRHEELRASSKGSKQGVTQGKKRALNGRFRTQQTGEQRSARRREGRGESALSLNHSPAEHAAGFGLIGPPVAGPTRHMDRHAHKHAASSACKECFTRDAETTKQPDTNVTQTTRSVSTQGSSRQNAKEIGPKRPKQTPTHTEDASSAGC